jgi:hypothetical protein
MICIHLLTHINVTRNQVGFPLGICGLDVGILQFTYQILCSFTSVVCGPGSLVGIATGYGLDGSGIKFRWGQEFSQLSRTAFVSNQLPVQWVPCLDGGKKRPGRDVDPTPTSSAVGHERVELYLYSPYGPYGLYRASVPVQGGTHTSVV